MDVRRVKELVFSFFFIVLAFTVIICGFKFSTYLDVKKQAMRPPPQPKVILLYHYHMNITPNISQPQTNISQQEIELMARLIFSEAGIESDACKYAVANVVINRLNHPNYPNTVYDVIHQKGQFSVIADNSFYDKTPCSKSYEIAKDVLQNNIQTIPNDILFFKADYSSANWGDPVIKIDRTEFYSSIK